MRKIIYLLFFFLAGLSPAISSYDIKKTEDNHSTIRTETVSNIHITGNTQQRKKILQWLNHIADVKKGRDTLIAIISSPHQLTIKHSDSAKLSAGRTIAPMTMDLINGKGADITIIFYADMPDSGTHKVYNHKIELIEFNAVQNLYHELAHAMHQMQGTWRYFASEKQAIEEENIFRQQLAITNNTLAHQRYSKSGELIQDKNTLSLHY